jgi:hypothetical protein
MDYSKLFGFDTVVDELEKGIDFQNPTIGAKLGAKVGKMTTVTKDIQPMNLPFETAGAAGPIMRGLRGRTVTST